MPNSAPDADMPMISTAPRLAEMNARPVTHAGRDRPERKKSNESETWLRDEADAQHDQEVVEQDRVVDERGVDDRRPGSDEMRADQLRNGHKRLLPTDNRLS